MTAKQKNLHIEALRGLAIIGVVSIHIIGPQDNLGLKVADDSLWRITTLIFSWIRMPLFTVISGYVYAYRPIDTNKIGKFIKGKTRRLLLPLLSVATLSYLFQALIPGSNSVLDIKNIWKIYVFGYNQFWYLQSLFLVFMLLVLLEQSKLLSNIKNWMLVLTVSLLTLWAYEYFFSHQSYRNIFDVFTFSDFLYLLPFFLLGVGIKRFELDNLPKKTIGLLLLITALGIVLSWLGATGIIDLNMRRGTIYGMATGIAATLMLTNIKFNSRLLIVLGGYSFPIFLLHFFGAVPVRNLLYMFNITDKIIVFSVSLIFGLLLPILAAIVINYIPFLRVLIFGGNAKKKIVYNEEWLIKKKPYFQTSNIS